MGALRRRERERRSVHPATAAECARRHRARSRLRPHDDSGEPADGADSRGRPARRSHLRRRPGDFRFHPDGAERRSAGDREDRGLGRLRSAQRLRRVPRLGEPAGPHDRERDAARQQQHPPGRLHRVRVRHVLRPAQRRSSSRSTRSAAAPTGRAPTSGSSTPTGIRSGSSSVGQVRGRLDDRSGDSVQVAPLRVPGTAQVWGFQARRTNKWKNEIAYLTTMPPAFGIGRGSFCGVALRDGWSASRRRRRRSNLELKPYAIGDLTTDQHRGAESSSNDPGGDFGVDAKYSSHAEPDRRPHLQHRLRAGRSRRAAGEPDALQPVLSREARLLPRESRACSRSAAPAARATAACRRHADSLLQPAHRAQPGTREVPIWGGGRAHRPRRTLQRRPDQHADARPSRWRMRRRPTSRRGPREARHPAPQQHRRACHVAVGDVHRARLEPAIAGVDGTFAFFSNLAFNTYFAKIQHRQPARRRSQLPRAAGLRRRSLRPSARAPDRRRQLQSRGRVPAPRRHAQALRARPLQPAVDVDQRACASSRRSASSPTSQNGAGRLETRIGDGEFAIEFQNSDRFSVGVNDDYELLKRAVPGRLRRCAFRWASTTSRPAASATSSASSDRSRAACSSSGAVLQRRADDDRLQPGEAQRVPAPVARAEHFAQLDYAAGRALHDQTGRIAHHLHDHAAAVRQRARPVQLQHEHRVSTTRASAGSTGRAASCSSSTTRSGTARRSVFPTPAIAA